MNKNKVVVIFEVKPKKECLKDYLADGINLKIELSKMEGFISAERFSSLNEDGKLLSLSVWENEESVMKWRNHIAHRQSQKAGYNFLFEKYHITVASVIREYANDDRMEAPQDSNDYLIGY
ncbi:MAG: antibiotic biosynthesis monooxygenase [Prevotella sp.]|jgi:heme-degrading monooxygenase HmoA|nr:antibiotic biosynthesis monooxygenase [Prevotella sp.]